MYKQVFRLNDCINSYNILNTMQDKEIRFMYRQLLEEYNINRYSIYRMPIVKYDYFMCLDNVYLPHINYMRQLLINRSIEVDSIDKEFGLKINE